MLFATSTDSFLTNTSMLDQLIAFVRSKPFSQVLKSEYDMNSHGHYGIGNKLRAPALKVLISLTSDILQPNSSVISQNTSTQTHDNKLSINKILVPNTRSNQHELSSITSSNTSDSSNSSSSWFSCAVGRQNDSPDGHSQPGNLNDDTSVSKIKAEDYKRIRRYLCNLIGSAKNLEYLMYLLVSEEGIALGGLAIRLIANHLKEKRY